MGLLARQRCRESIRPDYPKEGGTGKGGVQMLGICIEWGGATVISQGRWTLGRKGGREGWRGKG